MANSRKQTFILLVVWFYSILPLHDISAQHVVKQQTQKLGTTITITAEGKDSLFLENTISNCWELIDSLNTIFSDYEPDSEVSRLSESSGKNVLFKVSDPLWDVVASSQTLWVDSQGAFDITIGPLSKLWRRAFRRNVMPIKDDITEAMSSVGMENIILQEKDKTVILKKENMRVDLGGIAKGYIVDSISQYLQSQGVTSFLIDAGGDIYVGKTEGVGRNWNVVLENGTPISSDSIINKGMATSGSTYRYIESNGERYSHIIDPRTGYGVTHNHIVTVIAANCMLADALASTLSILTKEEGVDLASRYGAAVYYIK